MQKSDRNKIVLIGIMSYYAKQIFDETKLYEFRKSPIKEELLNEKIYVYSAKEDKAIIGYFRVSDILQGNTQQIMQLTGYDKRPDGNEIVQYYGQKNPRCFALKVYDVTEFDEALTLKQMRSVYPDVDMPQYLKFIYENDPLYDLITEWDTAFSLDGTNLPENSEKEKSFMLQKAKENKRRR